MKYLLSLILVAVLLIQAPAAEARDVSKWKKAWIVIKSPYTITKAAVCGFFFGGSVGLFQVVYEFEGVEG